MIDYRLIVEAQVFYTKNDFKNMETPWIVPRWASDITRPKDRNGMRVKMKDEFGEYDYGDLVASGEQGFLATIPNGLNKGLYQTTAPCFRDEPVFDKWHLPHFMKLELISVFPDKPGDDLLYMMQLASHFAMANGHPFCTMVETSEGYDLMSKEGIELGSYGIRGTDGASWVYGTGLALPRFTDARNSNDDMRIK